MSELQDLLVNALTDEAPKASGLHELRARLAVAASAREYLSLAIAVEDVALAIASPYGYEASYDIQHRYSQSPATTVARRARTRALELYGVPQRLLLRYGRDVIIELLSEALDALDVLNPEVPKSVPAVALLETIDGARRLARACERGELNEQGIRQPPTRRALAQARAYRALAAELELDTRLPRWHVSHFSSRLELFILPLEYFLPLEDCCVPSLVPALRAVLQDGITPTTRRRVTRAVQGLRRELPSPRDAQEEDARAVALARAEAQLLQQLGKNRHNTFRL